MNKEPSSACRGWLAGWHFTPEPDRLFQEIANPLITTLSAEPLVISLRTTGLRAELSLPADAPAECMPGAAGLQLRIRMPEQTLAAYFHRNDSNSLIIETEDRRFGFASDGDVKESADGTIITARAGDFSMVLAVDWNIEPVRMAIVSGSGDPNDLAAKARGLLFTSARTAVEKEQASFIDAAAPGAPVVFNSMLQPVSPRVPFPWIADQYGEPVRDLPMTGLLVIASLHVNPRLAAGFIGNLVEAIDAGGNITGARAIEFPCLLQLVAHFHRLTGTWPRPPADDFARYTSYIKNLAHQQASLASQSDAPMLRVLVSAEIDAWSYIHQQSGQPMDMLSKEVRAITRTFEKGAAHDEAPHAWITHLEATGRQVAFTEFIRALDACTDVEQKIMMWSAGLLRCCRGDLPASPLAWQLQARASAEWSRFLRQTVAASSLVLDRRNCAAVALGLWADHREQTGTARGSALLPRALGVMTRRPVATGIAAAALALLFTGWLVAVQFRTSYTEESLTVELGMLNQLYSSGDYEQAMRKIDEIESRGGLNETPTAFIRGKIWYRQKKYAEAADSFRFCYEEEPENPAHLYNLALSMLAQGQHEKAIALFNQLATEQQQANPLIAARASEAAKIILSLRGP